MRLEQLEGDLHLVKVQNEREFNNKAKIQEELREANKYIRDLDDKIYKANNTSLELLR